MADSVIFITIVLLSLVCGGAFGAILMLAGKRSAL